MKCKILNLNQWELHKQTIEKLLADGRQVDLSYERSAKPVTRRQIGFFFAALVNQIWLYFINNGWSLTEKQVRYGLYKQVAQVVPNMTYDLSMFGQEPQVKHISDMETAEEMSEFISGVFTVIDTNPMYAGLRLTPDTYYSWLNHLTYDEINSARAVELPERDADYLNHIRSLPCIICGKQHSSHAHHAKVPQYVMVGKKSPDFCAIPLCPEHHLGGAHHLGHSWLIEQLKWIKIDLLDFCRLCYQRWLASKKDVSW